LDDDVTDEEKDDECVSGPEAGFRWVHGDHIGGGGRRQARAAAGVSWLRRGGEEEVEERARWRGSLGDRVCPIVRARACWLWFWFGT
jgi:hypothetical protein